MVTKQLYLRKTVAASVYIAVATYFHYEKVRRMMRTANVSYLLNEFLLFLKKYKNLSCVKLPRVMTFL